MWKLVHIFVVLNVLRTAQAQIACKYYLKYLILDPIKDIEYKTDSFIRRLL